MKHITFAILMALISIFCTIMPAHASGLPTTPKAELLQTGEREIKMRLVLEKYDSPMVGLESELINIADNHGLDWTLMAAIAGTESSFGKRMPYQCLNPYGWGIYGDNKLCFESFVDAAQAVATGLNTRFNTTSLMTIAKTYNTVSTTSWIQHTQFFINKIKNQEIPVHELPITL